MSGGDRNFEGQFVHRIRTGDEADRSSDTPLRGELIATMDGSSPKLYIGDGSQAGGYLVGPSSVFYGIESAGTDIGTFTAVPWGTLGLNTGEFTHSTSVNPSEVTFDAAGTYNVQVEISVSFTGSACTFECGVQRYNGSTWATQAGARGQETGASGDIRSFSFSRPLTVLAGWKVRALGFNSLLTTGNTALLANLCNINITQLR